MDYDDRQRKRHERQKAERKTRGEPEPVYHWQPPEPKAPEPPKRKRRKLAP